MAWEGERAHTALACRDLILGMVGYGEGLYDGVEDFSMLRKEVSVYTSHP